MRVPPFAFGFRATWVALGAGVIFACGSGPGAPVDLDTSRESPGPGRESPGKGFESPGSRGEPPGPGAGGTTSCFPCGGNYSCGSENSTYRTRLNDDGVCELRNSDDQQSENAGKLSCGGTLDYPALGVRGRWKNLGEGRIELCLDNTENGTVCTQCALRTSSQIDGGIVQNDG